MMENLDGLELIIPVYSKRPLVVSRAKGCWVYDTNGNAYLDFVSGIGVNALGHTPECVLEALADQMRRYLHVSNLYIDPLQAKLARLLQGFGFSSRVFFANSGTEANEAAIKLARAYRNDTNKGVCIVAMEKGFHGRTLGALSATGQPKLKTPFEPLLEGFAFVPFGDSVALEEALERPTLAVLLEVIQAEGGVNTASDGYFAEVSRLAERSGALLIVDEVQTGLGRTGKPYAFQHVGLKPDIVTLGKALGGGLPLACMLARPEIAESFKLSSHGSTFGGNPLAVRAGIEVVKTLQSDGFLAEVESKGALLSKGLRALQSGFPMIQDVRGKGLLWGVELQAGAKCVLDAAFDLGLLLHSAGESVVRFIPPLSVSHQEIETALARFKEALKQC